MSTVTEAGGRTRVALLRRTLEEREEEIAATNAKVVDLARREDEAGLEALREAPTRRLYQLGSEGRSRPLKLRLDREKAETKLATLSKEADAVRAVLVEERGKEREAEREKLIEVAAAFDRRESAEFQKVAEQFAAFVEAVYGAWAITEEREQHLRELTFDDERFRQEIDGLFWSKQGPYPVDLMRVVELLMDVGRGMTDRRGGSLQANAPNLVPVRKPIVQKCQRSESSNA